MWQKDEIEEGKRVEMRRKMRKFGGFSKIENVVKERALQNREEMACEGNREVNKAKASGNEELRGGLTSKLENNGFRRHYHCDSVKNDGRNLG